MDLAPANSKMFNLEKILAAELGAELLLKDKLSKIPPDKYDFILIDCPPNLGVLSVSAMAASGSIIIPVTAQYMALGGLVNIMQTIKTVRERLNSTLEIEGILVCQYDTRTRHSREILKMIRSHYGSQVLETVIRSNVRLAEASSFSQPINIYDTKSAGAEDYRAFSAEVLSHE